MASQVIPILPRRRPMPAEAGEPFRVTLPTGHPDRVRDRHRSGVPRRRRVDARLVADRARPISWRPASTTCAAGVRPVRSRDLHHDAFQGVPVRILQSGVGCASALVLVPDELERIFGADRQCLIAPMRDLLISMPADADRELVGWLNEEFSSMDPNGLALDAFVLESGALRYETLAVWPAGR